MLSYLAFDLLDADDTSHTWEAMASVAPARVPAVLQEVTALTAWAQTAFGTAPLALDDGGYWDAWLQVQADHTQPCTLSLAHPAGQHAPLAFPPGTQWVAVTLTLVTTAALAPALQQHLDAISAA